MSVFFFFAPLPQLALGMWLPEEHSRRSQRQAHDVRRPPNQWVLISVRTDALVAGATIDVRHSLVEPLMPGHTVIFMDPSTHLCEMCNLICLEQRVPGSALVVILACTMPSCALGRAVPQLIVRTALQLNTASPFEHRNVRQGLFQFIMPLGTETASQGTTDHIRTKPQADGILLHACALEAIRDTARAIDLLEPRQQAC